MTGLHIRDPWALGHFIGERILDITQHDEDEDEAQHAFVMVHTESGGSMKFVLERGQIECDHPKHAEEPK